MKKNHNKNYISLNISYLRSENNLAQDEFAKIFNVSRDVIGTYERGRAIPKIETIQQICAHFGITIDDFINKNLRTLRLEEIWNGNDVDVVEETPALQNDKHYMQKTIETQEKMIELLQEEIKRLKGGKDYKSKTA